MHARSLYGNREVSGSTEGSTGLTVRGGKAGAVVTDARFGEVRLCHSSCEAAEQSWTAGCGGGGAKGRGQGKRGPAKHAPDPEPKARDPGAEPRTASCKAQEERAVHRASPPSQRRHTADGVPRAQAQGRSGRGRGDMAGLRGGPRAQSRGPPQRDPPESVSAATISPDVHTEGGWSTKAAGGRSSGGQDRPGRMRHGAQRIYEEDFLGFSYGFRPGRGAHDALDALSVAITSRNSSRPMGP